MDDGRACCAGHAAGESGRRGRRVALPDLLVIWPAVDRVHARAGEIMARHWQLPADIRLAITLQHQVLLDGHPHPLASKDWLSAHANLDRSTGPALARARGALGIDARLRGLIEKESRALLGQVSGEAQGGGPSALAGSIRAHMLRAMEKLVYLLWKREADSNNDVLRDRIRADLPKALAEAGAKQIKLSISDGDVAAGSALHLGPERPDAMLSFWLECIQDRGPAEAWIESRTGRHAGYLVVESQPLRLDTDPAKCGARTQGFSLVGCIEPKAGLSHARFLEIWETRHRQVAIDTQSTFSYIRNEVVRPVTKDAPPWKGIIEEGFPSEALSNPEAFYDAVGDAPRFRENLRRMIESCEAFIAMKQVDSHPMSEYRFF